MTKTMKALVWQGPRQMTVELLPAPHPKGGEVIVRSEAAGICGSEVEGYLGMMANRVPPLVMGHEFAGTVVEVGEGIDLHWLGKRVAINPLIGCGKCRYCSSGRRNLCPDRKLVGVALPGGFAAFAAVPEMCLFQMPPQMDARVGALVEPLANGLHAIRKGSPEGAMTAVVIGAGTIGLACMQAALIHGFESVTVIERHPARRDHALRLGAHQAFADGEGVGPSVDLTIDAAGTEVTRLLALELLNPAGTALFIGMHTDETTLPWRRVIRGNHTIKGVFAYEDADFRHAIELLAEGRAGIGTLKEILPLDRGPAAFAELATGPTDDIKVFLGG
jgi:(R,R)-butanediol dehydrogenase / meso-butanediol dehydrogenase / diacetyl reductase